MAPRLTLQVAGGPNQVYRPGDVIRGQVELQSSGSIDVDCILVTFAGVVGIEYQRQTGGGYARGAGRSVSYYNDEFILFSIESRPFVGPYTLPANVHQWPFEFVIPTGHGTDGLGRGEYNPLPPTFEQHLLEYFVRGTCRVVYQVKARLVRPSALKIDPKAEHTITFLPWSPIPTEPPRFVQSREDYVHRSSLLQEGREKKSRSFKEKLRDTFSDDMPSVAFSLVCRIWDVNVDGGIQAELIVQHDESRSTASVVPDFNVKSVSAALLAHTTCLNPNFNSHEPDLFTSDIRLERPTGPGPVLISNQPSKMIVALPNVPPTFVSQLVNRWYTVHFTVKIECAGKTFHSKFEGPIRIVVPPPPALSPFDGTRHRADESILAHASQSPVGPGAENLAGKGEAPPAYDNATAYRPQGSKVGVTSQSGGK